SPAFLSEIIERLETRVYPVGMFLAEKVSRVISEGDMRCDYKLEPCPLTRAREGLQTHVRVRAGLIKCVSEYDRCYYYLDEYAYILMDEDKPLWGVYQRW
ncbi:MAG: hypothetical protein ACK4H7_05005, partial [Acidilobaceae archaeon]